MMEGWSRLMSKALEIPELSADEKRRFWDKVEKRADGCWIWKASTVASQRGVRYGKIKIRQHLYLAHRVSWSMSHGRIPDGMVLDHRCYNPLCVNPAHLHVVTHQENDENRLGAENTSRPDLPHSGFRGVTWDRRHRKWRVFVGHSRRLYYGGLYADVHEANRAAIALRNRLMSNNLLDR